MQHLRLKSHRYGVLMEIKRVGLPRFGDAWVFRSRPSSGSCDCQGAKLRQLGVWQTRPGVIIALVPHHSKLLRVRGRATPLTMGGE